MKKSENSKSKNRFFSVFLLPAIIPLWLIGWILSRTESLKKFPTISFRQNTTVIMEHKLNESKQET